MRLIPSLFALALALTPLSGACAAPLDPIERVKALVALDTRGEWAPIFDNQPTPIMARNFSPAFNAAWAAAMKRNKEFPVFDADPLTGVQSDGGALVVASATLDGGNVVAVIARKDVPSAKRRVTFVMEPFGNGEWLIGDILYPDGSSLRAILAAALTR